MTKDRAPWEQYLDKMTFPRSKVREAYDHARKRIAKFKLLKRIKDRLRGNNLN